MWGLTSPICGILPVPFYFLCPSCLKKAMNYIRSIKYQARGCKRWPEGFPPTHSPRLHGTYLAVVWGNTSPPSSSSTLAWAGSLTIQVRWVYKWMTYDIITLIINLLLLTLWCTEKSEQVKYRLCFTSKHTSLPHKGKLVLHSFLMIAYVHSLNTRSRCELCLVIVHLLL